MLFISLIFIISILIVLRVLLYRTGLILVFKKWIHWIEDRVHVHQLFKVPEFNHDNSQFNQFYGKVSTYLNSNSPCMEDSDYTNLFSRNKSNDILLVLDDNQTVQDEFLGARVTWHNQVDDHKKRTFVLRIKKKDKRRILKPYIQHIHTVSDEIEQNTRRERKLYMNFTPTGDLNQENRRWRSVPLTHPSTMDTIVMDSDVKNKVKSDLESFMKSKSYYQKQLGRVWKRSYLLYGPSGTGKSSFISAVAKFLSYDVYDLNLYKVMDDSDLKILLLQTTNKSVIVIEDLDHFLTDKSTMVSLSGLLNFMDGLVSSCCADERVFVFTANNKDVIDQSLLRPGRIDVHIHFPLCDFESFKNLANSYLGLKDHKLFPQVEGVFSTGAKLSAAEIGEIMVANRSSPTRALKTVITALNADMAEKAMKTRLNLPSVSPRLSSQTAVMDQEKSGELAPVKELRKLYGLLRMKSTKKIGPLDHDSMSMTDISR